MDIRITLVAFTISEGSLMVFLKPYPDGYFLPEQPIDVRSLDDEASSLAHSLPFITEHNYREQLYSVSDPEEGVVRVAYVQLVPPLGDAFREGEWFSLGRLPEVPKHIAGIISYARLRLRWKLEYTNVAYSLLPEAFTLSELQEVYEIIIGKSLDKRNFRKKINSLHLLVGTKKKKMGVGYRPAHMYRFRTREPVIVEII